jgi:hypothetical protein
MLRLLSALTVLQQQPSTPPSNPSIARVVIQPAEVAVQVGDTVRLTARPEDAAGRLVKDYTVRWFQGWSPGRSWCPEAGPPARRASVPPPRWPAIF